MFFTKAWLKSLNNMGQRKWKENEMKASFPFLPLLFPMQQSHNCGELFFRSDSKKISLYTHINEFMYYIYTYIIFTYRWKWYFLFYNLLFFHLVLCLRHLFISLHITVFYSYLLYIVFHRTAYFITLQIFLKICSLLCKNG